MRPRSKVLVFAKPKTPPTPARKPYGPKPVLSGALQASSDVFAREMNRDQGETLESEGVPLRAWVPNFVSRWF